MSRDAFTLDCPFNQQVFSYVSIHPKATVQCTSVYGYALTPKAPQVCIPLTAFAAARHSFLGGDPAGPRVIRAASTEVFGAW